MLKKHRFFSLALLCLVFASAQVAAQGPASPTGPQLLLKAMNDSTSALASDTTIFPLAYPLLDSLGDPINFNDSIDLIATFSVVDTSACAFVHLKVGITPGGDEIFDMPIPWNYAATNSVFIYNRQGSDVLLCLGRMLPGEYFYEVAVEDNNGNVSPAVSPTQVQFINLY